MLRSVNIIILKILGGAMMVKIPICRSLHWHSQLPGTTGSVYENAELNKITKLM
jgi:hypothetical protein